MISELVFFAASVFFLKKYYKRKNSGINFNDSICSLNRAVESVVKD